MFASLFTSLKGEELKEGEGGGGGGGDDDELEGEDLTNEDVTRWMEIFNGILN